jgi:hypothetical protein
MYYITKTSIHENKMFLSCLNANSNSRKFVDFHSDLTINVRENKVQIHRI